jgi:hypothetical protein
VILPLALIAACEKQTEIVELGIPRLVTNEVWAGGDILVQSQVPLTSYLLVSGTDTSHLRQIDSTTWAGMASSSSGTVSVIVIDPEGRPVLHENVTIRGFLDVRPGPLVAGYPLPLSPQQGSPVVILNGESSLVRVDLRSGLISSWPSSIHDPDCMRGPGPTPTEGVYVTAHRSPSGGCTWSLWRLEPSIQKLADSIPINGSRLAGMFTTNRFLVSPGQHVMCLQSLAPATQSCRSYEEMNGMRFSPRGDRSFVYYGYSASNHVPVYDTQTGDTAYTIADADASEGGSFTNGGDTLYLAVVGSAARLLILNSLTGARYADLHIAATPREATPEDVLVDPQLPYAYVLVWRNFSDPVILVYDRRSSALVGQMAGSNGSSSQATGTLMCSLCDNRLIIDPATRQLYVLAIEQREGRASINARSSIARFSLLRD